MIEEIYGKVLRKTPSLCVVECGGLGIGLRISLNTFQSMEKIGVGSEVRLQTYLHVREDALQLFGFTEEDEKTLFQLLITISGVGPKLAIAILSGGSTSELRQAIATDNVSTLTRIPGVGKKTAQRLVLELKEKLQKVAGFDEMAPPISGGSAKTMVDEASSALLSLGYKEADARRVVQLVFQQKGPDIVLEELIKFALKEI